MKKHIVYIILILVLVGCKERQRKGAFQGVWYKEGFDMKAFTVRADSIYFPGLDKGYHFELDKDTLRIQFTEQTTKSKILNFSSKEITVWDMSLSKDTLKLQRFPTPFIDITQNKNGDITEEN